MPYNKFKEYRHFFSIIKYSILKSMKKRIIFIYPVYSIFIKNDYNLLQKHYNLTKFHFKPSKNLFKMLFQFLKQFLYLIFNIWRFDAVYIWFADYHSLMPVLFSYLTGKKSIIVIGGYDVCRIPDIKYGAFYSNFRGWFTAKSMKLTSINITVSKNIDRKTKVIAPYTARKLIYNGVNLLPDDSNQQKENIVLTVAIIAEKQTFYIKGIDTYLKVATRLPEYSFYIIGIKPEMIPHYFTYLPDNIIIVDKIPQQALVDYYKRAKVYCQLSLMESFGIALAEAMLFECIPVVSRVGALPEVVGNTGYCVKRNITEIANTIKKIMDSDNVIPGQKAKKQIINNFMLKYREEKLQITMAELLK